MNKNKRPLLALFAVIAAALACTTGGGRDISGTVNAVSTSVQATLEAQTPGPGVTIIAATAAPTLTPITVVTPTSPVVPPTAPAPTATTAGAATPPVAVALHAVRLATAPTIDGDLPEWSALPYSVDKVVYQPENWSGPADQSATFALGWDTTNLYLAIHVTDDAHVQTQLGELIFRGDSLELLVDTDLPGDAGSDELNSDDYQLGLTPGENKIGGPDAYLWFPSAKAGRPAGVGVSAHQDETGNGYYLEAAIAWSVFGVAPAAGNQYGFALSSSDNDLPGTANQQSMISSAPGRRLTNPTTWGLLVLDP
jgi:hypothetical protein